VALTAAGEAVCADAVTGEVRWRRAADADADRRPVTHDGTVVVFVTRTAAVTALTADTGEPLWITAASAIAGGSPVVLATGDVAWIDGRGALQARNPGDGSQAPLSGGAAVLRGTPSQTGQGRLWAFAEDESLRLLAATTGTALRRFPAPRAWLDFPPTVDGERAWVVGRDGSVAAFRADGETLYRGRLDDVACAPPAVSAEKIYVPTRRGSIRVLDAGTGEASWSIDVEGGVSAQPVVRDGKVFVATVAGALLAYAE
jgi:glucose dehydrogenase